jgi:hypothetical protein
MKYIGFLVGYNDPAYAWATASEEEQQAEMAAHGDFATAVEHREDCAILGGEALTGGDSATVLRQVGGEVTLTDGPFSEVTEAIGGFYLLEAPNLDVAVELFAALAPYVVEIRPVDTSVES